MKVISIFCAVVLLLATGCIERRERPSKIDPGRYFPLNVEDTYYYSGAPGDIVVIDQNDSLFTRAYYDTSNFVYTWEDYNRNDKGIFWNNVTLARRNIQVHFEPPLPFAPWSDMVGDTLLINSVEIRNDSLNSHYRIQAAYEILAVEDITTPAGTFENCIKMNMEFSYLDDKVSRIFAGEIIRWFAKDVGIVRYETSLVSGELVRAVIGGVEYPQ